MPATRPQQLKLLLPFLLATLSSSSPASAAWSTKAAAAAAAGKAGARATLYKEKLFQRTVFSRRQPALAARFVFPREQLAKGGTKVQVRRARLDDIPALSDVLARSFAEDPFAKWYYKPGKSESGHKQYLRTFIDNGFVLTTPARDAVAIWIPPGGRQQSRLERAYLKVDNVRNTGGIRNYRARMKFLDEVDKHYPVEPHFYLFVLGVDPAHQGEGLGTALMKSLLEQSDRAGIPSIVTTENPDNISLYEKVGFRLVDQVEGGTAAGDPPTVYFMRRPVNPDRN